MNKEIKRFFILGALISALLLCFSLPLPASIEINTAEGTIDAQFSIFNISSYPISFKYNPEISKGSVGAKWETSLDANLQLSDEVPIYTINAYCSKILFIKNEDGKFESGGGLGAKFEFINGDYTLTSNIGEKLTFDDKGNLKTIQDESGSASIINRTTKNLLSGWETKSDKIKTFSIDSALTGGTSATSNENAKIEWNQTGQISSIKADKEYKFIYNESLLTAIQVNGIPQYILEYNGKKLLHRLKEPLHDYVLFYYDDEKILSIDDAKGDSIYIEYDLDTTKTTDSRHTYVWNLTRSLRTIYEYTKDKVEIKEGPIGSKDVLFGVIDRKTGIINKKNINGDIIEVIPEKDGIFSVNSSLRGRTPYATEYSFGNLVLKNKNGVEYYKDLMSPSDFNTEKIRSEIKYDGIIRDLKKNILAVISNGVETIKYSYSRDGSLLEKATTSSGNELIYTYDHGGRVTQISDSQGNKTSFRYSTGRLEVIYPNGTSTNIVYNNEGLPVEILEPLTKKTIIGYQNTSSPKTVELRGFDTQSYIGSQDDGLFLILSNLFGRWIFIDNKKRTLSRISPSKNIIEYESNENNQIEAIIDSNNNKIATYSFDKYFKLTEASTDSCRIQFSYDKYGRLASKSYDKELSFDFGYDKKDDLNTITDSTGFSIKYIRDANGKLISLTSDKTSTFKISYYDSGLTKEIKYPNGNILRWVYDLEGKIIQYSILLSDCTNRTTKLVYDKIGNITQIDNGKTSINFSYDELGHITKITDSNGKTVDLNFDIWGNLLKLGKYESKLSNPSIYSQINNIDLSYNKISAITSYKDTDRECSVSYDWNDRLSRLQFNNGTFISFDYSPLDNQIYSVIQNNVEIKYYFLKGQLFATKDSTTNKFTKYIYLPGTNLCLAIVRPDGKAQYPLCDVFGSITDLTDKKGELIASRTFNSLGLLNSNDNLALTTGYEGLLTFDNGNIIFTKNGPVLTNIMRVFTPKAKEPGEITFDFSNKLSFMEIMPLVNFKKNPLSQTKE